MAISLTRKAGRAALLAVAGLALGALADAFLVDIPDWGYGLIVIGAIIESFANWEAIGKGYDQLEGWKADSPATSPKFADLEAYQRSAVSIASGPVPVEIEDGDFALLRKHRELLEALAFSQPGLSQQLEADARKIDESVNIWRRTAEEIRDGTRQASGKFDAEDYLARLNNAFPRERTSADAGR